MAGTAGSVCGSVGFEFGGSDDEVELGGPYGLTAMLSAEQGEASVYAYYDAEEERVSPGRLSAESVAESRSTSQPSSSRRATPSSTST